jgi:predicted helicase
MSTYDVVKTWTEEPLKAASIDIVCCDPANKTIGFDFCADDDSVFAHGHYDLEGAKHFYRALGQMIDELEQSAN